MDKQQDIWCIEIDKAVPYRFVSEGGTNNDGSIHFILAFAPHWGHDVYLKASDVFATLEECCAEINRRKAIEDAAEEAFLDQFVTELLSA